MLSWQRYDKAVDLWSVGCIFAEMLDSRPLFPGSDHIDQFKQIVNLLGFPGEELIKSICSEKTLSFLESLPRTQGIPFKEKFTQTDKNGIDLLEKLLVWDPQTRVSAHEALKHPYLEPYHDPEDEPEAGFLFDWSLIDSEQTLSQWTNRIKEVLITVIFVV